MGIPVRPASRVYYYAKCPLAPALKARRHCFDRMTAKQRLEKQTCHAVPCPCRAVLVMHRFLSPESKLRNAPSKNIFPGRLCFPPTPSCNVCERAPPTCLVSRVCKDPCIKTLISSSVPPSCGTVSLFRRPCPVRQTDPCHPHLRSASRRWQVAPFP